MKKIIAICFLFISVATHAAGPMKLTMGPGTATCGKYSSVSPDAKRVYVAWALGYMSAENFHQQVDFLKGTDRAAIEAAIDLYCRANPLQDVITAVADVISQLMQISK